MLYNFLFGYFIGTGIDFSAFPLFNWFIFPVFGIFYGDYYIRCLDKSKFFRFWPIFLIISVTYFVISLFVPDLFLQDELNFFYMSTYNVIFCLIYIHGNLGFCHWLSRFFNEKTANAVTLVSKNINGIYVIQWFLIPNIFVLIIFFNEDFSFNDLSLCIFSLFILLLSAGIVIGYKKLLDKVKC